MIERILYQQIETQLFKGKVVLLLGPRQVGKTTLLRSVFEQYKDCAKWLNADEADIAEELIEANTSTALAHLIGHDTKLVIIDEAQQIPNIGKRLKLIFDQEPSIQLIATGSSAFELSDQMNEPLTGRKRTYHLFPFSFQEMVDAHGLREEKRLLEHRMRYGYYPDVINYPGEEREVLTELVESYLYKDILKLEGIRKPVFLEKILTALALQLGSEVKYNEIARTVGNIDANTVERYIDLLEKAFVVFKLPALNRNFRNEIKKGKKYYFYDNGVRNAIINNFAPLDLRLDKGALWENFLVSERIKYNHYHNSFVKPYFWRTKDQAEIDFIEDKDGVLYAFEMKWKKSNARLPQSFREHYKRYEFETVHTENYEHFLMH